MIKNKKTPNPDNFLHPWQQNSVKNGKKICQKGCKSGIISKNLVKKYKKVTQKYTKVYKSCTNQSKSVKFKKKFRGLSYQY